MEQATGKQPEAEKKSLFLRFSQMSRAKKVILGIVSVILGAYIVLVIIRIPHAIEQQKTAETVAKIHAAKLTLDDVMGKNLPPDPGPNADKTIEGVDANKNGIRDDVELAIFKLHPDSARIRAAELQYAKALQNELTDVFNSGTLIAALQEANRGGLCVAVDTIKLEIKSSDSQGKKNNLFAIGDKQEKEIENLVFNTQARKDKREKIFDYMLSHGPVKGKPNCDIDLLSLPN